MVKDRRAGVATGLTLLVPITLSTMAIVLLAPILPLLMTHFAGVPGHEFLVPMILTMPALCVAFLSPVAGILGDRFGRRPLLIGALAIYGFLGLAPLVLDGLFPILISRVGVGITEAVIITLSTTMIADYFEGERRSRWLAGQTAMASVSALLFFNVGGQLGTMGWRAPFFVYASAFLMLGAVLAFTWSGGAAKAGLVCEKQTLGQGRWGDIPWAWMAGALGVTLFGSILFYTVQIQAAAGLAALGWSDPARIGFFTSIASIGVPLGTFVYGRVSRLPISRLLLIEFGLLAAGFVAMSLAHGPAGFLAGCAANQLGAGMLLPTLLVWSTRSLRFELRARGIGLWQGAFSLGQFASPIVVTLIGRKAGGLLPSFQYLGYAALIAAIVAAAWQRPAPVRPASIA